GGGVANVLGQRLRGWIVYQCVDAADRGLQILRDAVDVDRLKAARQLLQVGRRGWQLWIAGFNVFVFRHLARVKVDIDVEHGGQHALQFQLHAQAALDQPINGHGFAVVAAMERTRVDLDGDGIDDAEFAPIQAGSDIHNLAALDALDGDRCADIQTFDRSVVEQHVAFARAPPAAAAEKQQQQKGEQQCAENEGADGEGIG